MDLFKFLKSKEEELTRDASTKKYWEQSLVRFNKEVKGPNGNIYNEEELYNSIKLADRNRLLKFG